MATIYVRTTGNDTTGNGSTGTPYASLKKALSVAVAGDTILLGDGTYIEDSGAGYLNITQQFASRVTVAPESGTPGTVTIKGAGTSYGVLTTNAQNIWFDNLTFMSQADTVTIVFRFNGSNDKNLLFTRCTFRSISKAGQTYMCLKGTWTGASVAVDDIAFERCSFEQVGTNLVIGAYFDASPSDSIGAANRVTVRHCDFNVARPLQMWGCTNAGIYENTLTSSFEVASPQTCFVLGVDGPSGRPCSGVVAGNVMRTRTGHGLVIGAGTDGVLVVDNRVYGGRDTSGGQGLVLKEARNVRVEGNTVIGGYFSGIYLKGAVDCQVIDNNVYSAYSTAAALLVAANPETSNPSSGATVRRNYFHATDGKVISWADATGESGGSTCDENVYVARGSATLGTVRGTTVSTLSGVRAAWSGYNRAGNDRNSRTGQTGAVFAGARTIELP